MHNMRPNADNYKLPRPCDVFDVIAGTSTGGLIAILLGRLKLDVQTCIDVYIDLAPKIFRPKTLSRVFGKKFMNVMGSNTFSGKDLEDAIRTVLVDRGLPPDMDLLDDSSAKCHVYVDPIHIHRGRN
jgi:patatin-like phospholipase/acyl hydrolase